MNTILRSVFRNSALKCFTNNALRQNEACSSKRQFTRNLWSMCSSINGDGKPKNVFKTPTQSKLCSCGCGLMHVHTTKGDKELVDFLNEEISAERKLLKSSTIPVEVDGFKVKLDGSEVTLTKEDGSEKIEVSFNVNHSVDADVEPELNQNVDKPQLGEMKSKPVFEVEIQRSNKTLGFTCSFLAPGESQEDGYNDLFAIDEVTLYEGEWKDSNYAVSGEVLDGYLYDLLMNLLDDKGITNDFVEKLMEFSTIYEHNSYISLLEGLKKFAGSN